MIVDPGRRWIFRQYDGGMDLIPGPRLPAIASDRRTRIGDRPGPTGRDVFASAFTGGVVAYAPGGGSPMQPRSIGAVFDAVIDPRRDAENEIQLLTDILAITTGAVI